MDTYNNSVHSALNGLTPNDAAAEDKQVELWFHAQLERLKKLPLMPKYKFNLYQNVRTTYKDKFRKGFAVKTSENHFRIVKRKMVDGVAKYTLISHQNKNVPGTFTEDSLQKVIIDNDVEYVPEKILGYTTRQGEAVAAVKWLGYGDDQATYIPVTQLPDLLDQAKQAVKAQQEQAA